MRTLSAQRAAAKATATDAALGAAKAGHGSRVDSTSSLGPVEPLLKTRTSQNIPSVIPLPFVLRGHARLEQ